MRFPAIALALLLFSSTPVSAESAAAVIPDISYGPRQANHLDLCRADDGGTNKTAILLIHGGGWKTGDKQDLRNRCQWFAEKGFVAATVNYRLADLNKPDSFWPAQLSDVQLAMRWLRKNAKEYGINPNNVCALGGSAGGHLAVFLGVTDKVVKDDNAAIDSEYSSFATCVVDEFGMTDFTDPHAMPGGNTALFGGATLEKNPAAYAAASPLPLVSANSAPMLIAHGYTDPVIPFTQGLRLLQALAGYGVPAQFIGFPGGHGFGPAQQPWINDAELQFLRAH